MSKYVIDNYLGHLVFPDYDETISNHIQKFGIWEPKELNWLFENVKEGDTCINVGANVGYFSTVMSKLTKENGKVYSIEANPEFKKYIEENINLSGFDNVEVIMCAAGNFSGNIELFINSYNSGDNRVFNPDIIKNPIEDSFSNTKKSIIVNIDKIDNLIKSKNVDIVLIDCQGWDHEVIRGMSKIINKNKPKILTEFVPKWVLDLGEDPINLLNEYKNMGYDLLCPDLDLNEPSTPEKILEKMYEKNMWFFNLYMKPNVNNAYK